MRRRVTVVSLSVCLSSLYSASLRHVCDELNLPAKSLLHPKGFQPTDFAKKLSSWVMACSRFSTAKHSVICIFQYRKPDLCPLRIYTACACAWRASSNDMCSSPYRGFWSCRMAINSWSFEMEYFWCASSFVSLSETSACSVRPPLSTIIHTRQHNLTTEGPMNTILEPTSIPEQLLSIKCFKKTCYLASVSGIPPITVGNLLIINHRPLANIDHTYKTPFRSSTRLDWSLSNVIYEQPNNITESKFNHL